MGEWGEDKWGEKDGMEEDGMEEDGRETKREVHGLAKSCIQALVKNFLLTNAL